MNEQLLTQKGQRSLKSSRSSVCSSVMRGVHAATGILSLCDRWILLFVLCRGIGSSGFLTMVKYTVKRAVNLGLTDFHASLLLSVNGLFSVIGRVGSSAVATPRCTNRLLQFSVCMALNGLTVVISAFAGSDVTFQFAIHAAYGLFFGKVDFC